MQEPSQQIIEQAAKRSLDTNADFAGFLSNLKDSAFGNGKFKDRSWWDTFKQVAPEVGMSTLIAQVLFGLGGIATRSGRKNINSQYEASQVLGKMGINTVQQGQEYLDNLIKQRSPLKAELDTLTDLTADPNIDNSARIQELTNSISEIDTKIKDFLEPFSNFYNVFGDKNVVNNYFKAPYNFGENELEQMKAQRDRLQEKLTSLYQSMTGAGDMDTDIEALNKAQALQTLINNLDDIINKFWRNPEVNTNAFAGSRDDYNAEQINQNKQYEPTSTYTSQRTAANQYPEGMFVHLEDENNQQNNQPEPEQQAGFFDRVKSFFGLGQNNAEQNNDDETFDYEDDEEIRNLSKKIYQGIKGFNINNEQAKFVSHIIATGARHFASYAGVSVDDYLQARGFKIVYDTRKGAYYQRDKNGKIINIDKGNIEYVSNPTDEHGNILREADNIIKIYTTSDVSTFFHENGHFFLNDFRDLFRAGKLKGQGLQDWVTLVNWLGVADLDFSKNFNQKSLEGSRWHDAQEKFAVAFERYMREGIAPNSKLKRAFEAVKRWMHDIYQSLLHMVYSDSNGQARHFNLSPEIRQVMSNIFTDFNTDNNSTSTNNNADTLSMFTDEENNADTQRTTETRTPSVMAGVQDDETSIPYEAETSREGELYAIKNSSQEQLKDKNITQDERDELQANIREVNRELRKINKDIQQRIIQNFNDVTQGYNPDDNAPLLTFAPEQEQTEQTDNEAQDIIDENRLTELKAVIEDAKTQLQNSDLETQSRRRAIYTLMEATRELIATRNNLDKQTRREITRTLKDATKQLKALNKAEKKNAIQNFNDVEQRTTQETSSSIPTIDELQNIAKGYTPEQNTRQEITPNDEPDSFLDDFLPKKASVPNVMPTAPAATVATQEAEPAKAKKKRNKKQSEDGDITREEYSGVASSLANLLAARENPETYNQSAPLINNGEKFAGNFIFSTRTKSHSLNVIAQADNRNDRLTRQRGRALELRNNRGDVFAAYYPYSDSFIFNYTGTNHSQAWKDAFENNFRIHLPEFLANGGFTDTQGRLKSDGNEDFRTRWAKRNTQDPDAFFDDDLQPEDYEAPKKIGSMNVNHAGRQLTFGVYTGEFSSNDPDRQKFFGRYLEVRDESNRVLARYSPLAKKLEMSKLSGAKELREPILQQLKAHGREYLSKGGFLDEDGKIKSDNSEDFRKSYKNRKLNIGKTAKARTIKGTEVTVRYRVVEADKLIASNKENGGINPEYPQELQPRQRSREASQQQIAVMAGSLDPELLAENRLVSDGAPVIGSDLVVESGNGRVLAIRRA